jgi:hypothetical protein
MRSQREGDLGLKTLVSLIGASDRFLQMRAGMRYLTKKGEPLLAFYALEGETPKS